MGDFAVSIAIGATGVFGNAMAPALANTATQSSPPNANEAAKSFLIFLPRGGSLFLEPSFSGDDAARVVRIIR